MAKNGSLGQAVEPLAAPEGVADPDAPTISVEPVSKPRRGRTPRDPEKTVKLTPAKSLEAQISNLGFFTGTKVDGVHEHLTRGLASVIDRQASMVSNLEREIDGLQRQAAGLQDIVIQIHGRQMEALGKIHEQNAASPIARIFMVIGIAAVVLIAILALNNWTAVVTALFG